MAEGLAVCKRLARLLVVVVAAEEHGSKESLTLPIFRPEPLPSPQRVDPSLVGGADFLGMEAPVCQVEVVVSVHGYLPAAAAAVRAEVWPYRVSEVEAEDRLASGLMALGQRQSQGDFLAVLRRQEPSAARAAPVPLPVEATRNTGAAAAPASPSLELLAIMAAVPCMALAAAAAAAHAILALPAPSAPAAPAVNVSRMPPAAAPLAARAMGPPAATAPPAAPATSVALAAAAAALERGLLPVAMVVPEDIPVVVVVVVVAHLPELAALALTVEPDRSSSSLISNAIPSTRTSKCANHTRLFAMRVCPMHHPFCTFTKRTRP